MPDVQAVGQQVLANEIGADGRAALRGQRQHYGGAGGHDFSFWTFLSIFQFTFT